MSACLRRRIDYRAIATSTAAQALSSTIFFSDPDRFSLSRNSLT
jgi:hypothetical protein